VRLNVSQKTFVSSLRHLFIRLQRSIGYGNVITKTFLCHVSCCTRIQAGKQLRFLIGREGVLCDKM